MVSKHYGIGCGYEALTALKHISISSGMRRSFASVLKIWGERDSRGIEKLTSARPVILLGIFFPPSLSA